MPRWKAGKRQKSNLGDRKGHRKEASRLELAGKLILEAAAALDEQLKTFQGLSGGDV